ncbi:MAG TPA: hypothetical protein P5195_04015, partial [Anaerolineae bacterium]|nr:hypothetical protein [Anaerolineae bacterium]
MLLARLAQARGDTHDARKHIEESLQLFHRSGATVDEARSRYWSARFYLDCEATQQAHDELLRAREIFAHLGAAADLQETEAALAQLEHETAH